jgi:hypothetical protein
MDSTFCMPRRHALGLIAGAASVPLQARKLGAAAGAFGPTVTLAEATIPADVQVVETSGFYQERDGGGALWRRSGAEPAHPAKFRSADRYGTDGSVNDATGGWFELLPDRSIDVRTLGAKGDGRTDDTQAVRRAHEYAQQLGVPVEFPTGTYSIRGWEDVGDRPIRWLSKQDAAIHVSASSLVFGSRVLKLALSGSSVRDQRRLKVLSSDGVQVGAIANLFAAKVVERFRNEPICAQTARVAAVEPGILVLDQPLTFDFAEGDPEAVCCVYNQPRSICFEGLDLVTVTGNTHGRTVTLVGLEDVTAFRNCTIRSDSAGDVSAAPDGVMVQQSIGVRAEKLRIMNTRYGYMEGMSRDGRVNGVVGIGTRHPIYPYYWTSGFKVRDLVGRSNVSSVDSHSAFDVAYEQVRIEGDSYLPNVRASGAVLRDAHVTITKGAIDYPLLLAPQLWVPDYKDLFFKRDVIVENVELHYEDAMPGNLQVLDVGGGREVRVRNFNTYPGGAAASFSGATPHQIQRVTIERSNLAFPLSASNTRIRCPISILDGGVVPATRQGDRYVIQPWPFAKINGGMRCRGSVVRRISVDRQPLVVEIRLYDHSFPFATGAFRQDMAALALQFSASFEGTRLAGRVVRTAIRVTHRFAAGTLSWLPIVEKAPHGNAHPSSPHIRAIAVSPSPPPAVVGLGDDQYVDIEVELSSPSGGSHVSLEYALVAVEG